MSYLRFISLLCLCWPGLQTTGLGQAQVKVKKPTNLTVNADQSPDTVRQTVPPKSLTFTASTDQRFFFFEDTRNDNGKRMPVSVYGVQAGFLFPTRRQYEPGGKRAAFKLSAGFYFVNQELNRPGLLPNTSEAVKRHLRIVTGHFEPYLYRKKAVEISLPLEIGYGHSRYELVSNQTREGEVARGVFIPAGAGVSVSYQFPALWGFRPLRWIGFNMLTGYRFILKRDVPESQINYSGLYVSVGPSFYLENFTSDVKRWRQKRKNRE